MAKDIKKYYYQVDLEVALKKSEYVFGFINISHIPYKQFELLFADQITDERFLFDDSKAYFITEKLYAKNKVFFDKEIPFTFNFDLFEYSVGLSSIEAEKYKKNYYTNLPHFFNKDTD